ncbi:flavin reductase family protein [Martelella mediterranea]|uniref:Cob(II)yrinic acid a,c-diamide reductase n=1 Tax=Martelella mediterranea TaxID=293089 RepID=A0A4R3NV10_9HYPH|nr:flavin reductase family protein [Martelella mediterranea]TCT40892.1 cob(II)yrinic acid a,c-diamide reductase [Martelella mediterranea]
MHDDYPLPEIYREAMARFAGHVQIVTTSDGVSRRGITATACCSISDTPPTVLACVNRQKERNHLFKSSGNFAINSLAAKHQPLADAFAGRGELSAEERFARGSWSTGASGAPVLDDALVSFDCRLVDAKVVATHWILIGEVIAVRMGDDEGALVYYSRGYRNL